MQWDFIDFIDFTYRSAWVASGDFGRQQTNFIRERRRVMTDVPDKAALMRAQTAARVSRHRDRQRGGKVLLSNVAISPRAFRWFEAQVKVMADGHVSDADWNLKFGELFSELLEMLARRKIR